MSGGTDPPLAAEDPGQQPESLLSDDERARHASQLALPAWSEQAQVQLRSANVQIVGSGARGAIVAALLASAGVGQVGLIDGAQVEAEDLGGQVLNFSPDVTINKADALNAKLGLINPNVHGSPFPANVDQKNADLMLEGFDLVIDCTSDPASRKLINDACAASRTPLVTGGATAYAGSVLTILPGQEFCIHCTEEIGGGPLAAAAEASFGPTATAIGSLQASEAIKILNGVGRPLTGAVTLFDALELEWRRVPLTCSTDCACAQS